MNSEFITKVIIYFLFLNTGLQKRAIWIREDMDSINGTISFPKIVSPVDHILQGSLIKTRLLVKNNDL